MANVRVPGGRRASSQPERVGVACESFSYEKVISPMSYIMSHTELAEGSHTMSLQDIKLY